MKYHEHGWYEIDWKKGSRVYMEQVEGLVERAQATGFHAGAVKLALEKTT